MLLVLEKMKTLVINHKLYGQIKITKPVLIDLIKSPALQRLKNIEQHGTWQFHKNYKKKNRFTRYDHSIGVMLLLKRFGASWEEQIHGLLHDISHTAFSHVADFTFGSDHMKHDYQDNRIAKAYELQGVNKILKKHRVNKNYILNEKNFPLAEKELPDLCADRIDYTLQDPWGKELIKIHPKKILENLTVFKNQFVFKNQSSAKSFAELNFKLNQNVWCNPLQVAIYHFSAKALQNALKYEVITKKDFYQDDDYLINKLLKTDNSKVLDDIKKIKNLEVKEVKNKKQADICRSSKPRIVDPSFIKNGKLIRLTDVDKKYKEKTADWIKKVKKGFYIKILS